MALRKPSGGADAVLEGSQGPLLGFRQEPSNAIEILRSPSDALIDGVCSMVCWSGRSTWDQSVSESDTTPFLMKGTLTLLVTSLASSLSEVSDNAIG